MTGDVLSQGRAVDFALRGRLVRWARRSACSYRPSGTEMAVFIPVVSRHSPAATTGPRPAVRQRSRSRHRLVSTGCLPGDTTGSASRGLSPADRHLWGRGGPASGTLAVGRGRRWSIRTSGVRIIASGSGLSIVHAKRRRGPGSRVTDRTSLLGPARVPPLGGVAAAGRQPPTVGKPGRSAGAYSVRRSVRRVATTLATGRKRSS